MVEALHLGALLPAAVGVSCTAGGRRGAGDLLAAIVMLVAMVDVATGAALLTPLTWSAVLVVVAMLSALRLRIARQPASEAGERTPRRHTGMVLHTSTGLLVMAAMLVAMAGHGAHAALGISSQGQHHAGMSGGVFGLILVAAVAAYLAFTSRLAVITVREHRTLATVELVSMALSVATMGVAVAAA